MNDNLNEKSIQNALKQHNLLYWVSSIATSKSKLPIQLYSSHCNWQTRFVVSQKLLTDDFFFNSWSFGGIIFEVYFRRPISKLLPKLVPTLVAFDDEHLSHIIINYWCQLHTNALGTVRDFFINLGSNLVSIYGK